MLAALIVTNRQAQPAREEDSAWQQVDDSTTRKLEGMRPNWLVL